MNSKKSLLRRHPYLIVLALLFFAFSLTIILAAYMGAPASSADKRRRKRVNTYRLPADFSFAPIALSPEGSVMDPAKTEPVPAGAVVVNGINERLFYVVFVIVGVIVGVLIATLMTKLLIK